MQELEAHVDKINSHAGLLPAACMIRPAQGAQGHGSTRASEAHTSPLSNADEPN
jgi:hypothetical protein